MNKLTEMPACRLIACIARLAGAIDYRGMRGEMDGSIYSALAWQQKRLLSYLDAKLSVAADQVEQTLGKLR